MNHFSLIKPVVILAIATASCSFAVAGNSTTTLGNTIQTITFSQNKANNFFTGTAPTGYPDRIQTAYSNFRTTQNSTNLTTLVAEIRAYLANNPSQNPNGPIIDLARKIIVDFSDN